MSRFPPKAAVWITLRPSILDRNTGYSCKKPALDYLSSTTAVPISPIAVNAAPARKVA